MNRPELYNRTVDILFNAYFKDELEHGDCQACAVGNIVAANMGIKIIKMGGLGLFWENHTFATWVNVFYTPWGGTEQVVSYGSYHGRAKEEIEATGYLWDELAKIEYAFETANKGDNEEDYMFNGLVAVLNVLKTLHEVEEDAEEVSRFTNHYSLKKSQHEQARAV